MPLLPTTHPTLARRKLQIGIQTFHKMKDLFEGHQALFTGLAAETRWDWTKSHPVIRVSFSDGVLQNRAELDQRIREGLSSRWWRSRLIGVEFSKVSRNIVGFEVDKLLIK